ncbi:MAG: 5-oxoprolinase subunit PxpB [Rudaea sp.]|uniref:5-oxoprolinase subunit PxpB n=1 Tax=Rudaea sp. TaxID=2136325 RepID=UPI0039E3D3DD
MSGIGVEWLGDRALLLCLGDAIDTGTNSRAHDLAGTLRAADLPGVADIVPAYASVAVHYNPAAWADAGSGPSAGERLARRILETALVPDSPTPASRERESVLEIPVCYGGEYGPDLADVARHARLDETEVIARHARGDYRVAMLGFAPGFPYLLGLDRALHAPRRARPRTRVPAGSVAIGGAQTGIYPRELPGGWQIIGRTPLTLFDAARDPPALLAPGTRVRFRSISSTSAFVPDRKDQKAAILGRTLQQEPSRITVLAPGLLTTVQDAGRRGFGAIGVGSAGAMDAVSLRLANLLVGNAQDAAALEITLHGPRLRFDSDALIALTGAEIEARCASEDVPRWRPVLLRAGSELHLGGMRRGARAYLAVAGGIDLPRVLGSRATDLNAGLGPLARALAAGDSLPTAPSSRDRQSREAMLAAFRREDDSGNRGIVATRWSLDAAPWFDADAARTIRAIAGSHFDRLDADSQRALFGAEFRVGVDSNRVGFRLEGAALNLAMPLELVSAGAAPGTVQLPPGGAPIALAAEAPTTGGYPRIAHIIAVDQPRFAQRRPGDRLRFAQTDLADAQMRYLERERALAKLETWIRARLHRPW